MNCMPTLDPRIFTDAPPETFESMYREGYADVSGVRLHYTDWNPSGERTIVLVHGLNVQLHTWDPIAAALSADWRVICFDNRGHGDSSWGADYWLKSFVNDLDGLVTQLGLTKFALVGHSLGARITLAYAGEHPDRVTHVVLSDTGPEVAKSAAKYMQAVIGGAADVRGFKDEAHAAEVFRGQNPEWREVYIGLHARHQLRRSWAGKLVLKSDPELFWLTGGAGLKDNAYVWDMAAEVAAPTLVLWGETSHFLDDELADRLLATLQHGELVRIASGHFIPREEPEAFVDALRSFLERRPR